MAQQTRTVFVDDLTGKEIPEDNAVTLRFSYGGNDFEIDLSSDNAAQLDEALRPYIDAARRVRGGSTSKPKSSAPAGTSLQEIREWARANGHTLSDRGRISADILSAYRQAHK